MHGLTKQGRAGNRTDIAALLIALDHHHIRVSDAGHDNPCCRTRGRRPKASREGTRGEEFCGGALYGDFGIADGSAARRREGREEGSTALVSVRDRLW